MILLSYTYWPYFLPWFIIYSIIHCYQGFRFQKTSISRSFNVFFSLNPSTANKLSTTDFLKLIAWFIRDKLIIKIIIKRAKTWLWVLASTCLRKRVATFWKRSTRLLHLSKSGINLFSSWFVSFYLGRRAQKKSTFYVLKINTSKKFWRNFLFYFKRLKSDLAVSYWHLWRVDE